MSNVMGERIRELRKQADMTQEELGKLLGVQKSAIRKYEKGEVENIPRSKIQIMCERFGVDPCYLLGLPDSNKESDLLNAVRSTYGDPACEMLKKFAELDSVDQGKLIERANTLLEDKKYSVKESFAQTAT